MALMSLNVFGEFLAHEMEYIDTLRTLDPLKGVSAQFQSQHRNLYTPQGTDGNMYFSQSGFMSRQSKFLNDMIGDKMKALNSELKNAKISNDMNKAKKMK